MRKTHQVKIEIIVAVLGEIIDHLRVMIDVHQLAPTEIQERLSALSDILYGVINYEQSPIMKEVLTDGDGIL